MARRSWVGWLTNAALLLVSVVSSIAVGEIVVRFHYDGKFSRKPRFLVADPELGWNIAADLDDTFHGTDFKIAVRTDHFGARLGRRGAPDLDDPIVVLVGDSYTFGWGVNDDETFAAQLDDLLERESSPVRVVNLGVGGYGTLASAVRLDRFLDGSSRSVRAIVVMHSHNDMSDNVTYQLHRSGLVKPKIDPAFRPLSRWELVNFVEFVALAETTTVTPKRDKDELFEFEFMTLAKPDDEVIIGSERIMFRDLDLRFESAQATMERGTLSDRQMALMRESLFELSCKRPRVTILHTVVHFAPAWYAREIEKLLAETIQRDCPADVRFVGAMTMPIAPPHFNAHSGGHFNPRANRSYAEQLLEHLRGAHVLDDAQ